MPLCLICNSRSYPQTWQSPAEPCDCGRNYDLDEWDDDGRPDLTHQRDAWARGETLHAAPEDAR